MAVLGKPEQGTEDAYNTSYFSDDLSISRNQTESSQRPLNFENRGLIWFPPPPDDENDEAEGTFFPYDDEDDDVGESGALFSSSSSLSNVFSAKEKENEGNKEPLKAVIEGHFRALVLQFLQGEGIKVGKEDGSEDWLDIVATLAWQAANYVRADTSKGGSMDPGNYVKVKCIAGGSPSESTLIKGVVCTKTIKHKRMTSQYQKPRLLLLGGALEFQKVPNQLASFDTLLQQENDLLKIIISKIEALRPNVLLVEKSVALIALEYLLAKEISLVLNVKRPLLDRIARCTGGLIAPSVDSLSKARLGHCELFRLDKMVEDHETANQPNKKSSKTLMFFEGCPSRLGCTVLLKGACREDLKKIKHVVQYAVFAAYHLSLETSFLADEGATLPKMRLNHSMAEPDRLTTDPNTSALDELEGLESKGLGSAPEYIDDLSFPSDACTRDYRIENIHFDACQDNLTSNLTRELVNSYSYSESYVDYMLSYGMRNHSQSDLQESMVQEEGQHGQISKSTKDNIEEDELSGDYFSATDHQSILVYYSRHCVSKVTICEQSRLLQIKFYGSFDKPLGRYLRDDLFDETLCCQSCKEPVEAHVQCYTHQQGNLTINIKCLPSVKLPGERDGKIWMWHRCLKCPHDENGVPPATRRVVMSDAAWGLSLGKFLEQSFSNHATANRVAPCGHSLQRDCLRYYGFGSMVAFFRYSPIDILSVHLPPLVMEFDHNREEWIRKESRELLSHVETLYQEISDVLGSLEKKSSKPRLISFGSRISEGVQLLHSQTTRGDRVTAVYDNDYSSIISYALSSKEYDEWVTDKLDLHDGSWITRERSREDLDYTHYGNYRPEDASSSIGTLLSDSKRSGHSQISFGDDSSGAGGKVNFSVTCYFAKQFDLLRKKCCPNEVVFVRSLRRCRRWQAQGGKSNVYFTKSLDERFIIKQVTKRELDSFEEFAPQYFKYLTESLNSGSPTCLARILGIYQVTLKYPKGGKETKIDVMVMENLFYKRNIARVYDLKGSERSWYNPDTTGTNKVMLDMNLLETLRTKPIFLGRKAKRSLERAVWNDTSFLASVHVMDYSLLVGVDEERKELVLGIIDFMRQYTWDKCLETWVETCLKASGILGPRNAAPTIVPPKQYKKRFRKAMTTYFLSLPDQWSSRLTSKM